MDVGSVSEFPEASATVLTIEGREIGLIRWRDVFYALRNICPHQAGPVCAGPLRAKLSAGPRLGNLEVDGDHPVLSCPWHGWEFDVRTGLSVTGHPYRVGTYAVQVKDGRVVVEVGGTKRKAAERVTT
jgi:nitrite reductase (NADH) small subunit